MFKKSNKPSKQLYKKKNDNTSLLKKGCLSLHGTIKNSYASEKDQSKFGSECGYEFDKELSNDNNQVYYNPKSNHLMMSVSGTHNVSDVGTDLKMMASGIKSTDRYKQAEMTLGKAKAKYNPKSVTATGHSLGGAIVSDLDGIDQKVTFNKAHTNPFKKTPGNETHLRTYGDIVSLASAGNKHTSNIRSDISLYNPMTWRKVHNSDQIKKFDYRVPGS